MPSTEFTRWGWLSGREGTPQDKTFDTPDEAITAMQDRLGHEPTLEQITELGFKLALLRVALSPVMVLEPVVGGGGTQ
jgi:hypothetical protein